MKCPRCNGPTRVYDTEQRAEGTARRRQCTSSKCGHKFVTLEKRAQMVRGYAWGAGG